MVTQVINGDLRMFGHSTVKVTHLIRVDKCIAKEIKMLNNKYNIVTEFSCCGHQNDFGYVTIKADNQSDALMAYLGYKELDSPRAWIFAVTVGKIREVAQAVQKVYQLKTKCTCSRLAVGKRDTELKAREKAYRERNLGR